MTKAASLRMKDLCQLSGLERQTIHFYIQEGLLPEGKKTGRNMAYYSPEHLERLRLIKQLQEERFLPLRAIRAVLGGKAGAGFSREQRKLLAEVKARLLRAPRGRALVSASATDFVDVDEAARAHGVSRADVVEMIELGLLSAESRDGGYRVRRDDTWLITAWADLARAGLSRERGFSPRDLLLVDEAVSELFAKERELFLERLLGLAPDEIASLIERVLPILGDLVARLHTQKARDTFALAIDDAAPLGPRGAQT